MKTIHFKCTLLSDVILNQKSATEGDNNTLDFIPGANFLGIVAGNYMKFSPLDQLRVFHSGDVKFSDGHLMAYNSEGKVVRSLKIPASIFYPKLKSASEVSYIHHLYSRVKDHEGLNGGPQQLKQCRNGFYLMDERKMKAINSSKTFSIKSAYDRELRKSKDEMMFGYESLASGGIYHFSVSCDDSLTEAITNYLLGTRHIGRSRNAQYGLVRIEKLDKPLVEQECNKGYYTDEKGNKYITMYAEDRLLFIDEYCQYTYSPDPLHDLGIDGTIMWEKSQVRTFNYSPWNSKRNNYDSERCGFEKGSVLVIQINEMPSVLPSYVGKFNQEGFGKVIFNPRFLESSGNNGETLYKIIDIEKEPASVSKADFKLNEKEKTPLTIYLANKARLEESRSFIYKSVNEFVKNYKDKYKGATFASQWGTIRSIAMHCNNYDDLHREIFQNNIGIKRNSTESDARTVVIKNMAYLGHGVAEDKWKKRNRTKDFKEFVERMKNSEYGDISCEAVVNLASEMAKICKK